MCDRLAAKFGTWRFAFSLTTALSSSLHATTCILVARKRSKQSFRPKICVANFLSWQDYPCQVPSVTALLLGRIQAAGPWHEGSDQPCRSLFRAETDAYILTSRMLPCLEFLTSSGFPYPLPAPKRFSGLLHRGWPQFPLIFLWP